MNAQLTIIWSLLLPFCLAVTQGKEKVKVKVKMSNTSRLHKRVLSGYDKRLRPTEEINNATTVHFSVLLIDILEIKEGTLEALMKASVCVTMHWKDERLAWSLGQHPAKTIVINPDKIWIPDIRLYNSLDPKIRIDEKVKAILYHDGTVKYDLPMWLMVHCHRPRGPNATWECPFKFSSWVYHGYQLDIYIRENGLDLSEYTDRVWGITGNTGERRAVQRRCCREPWPEVLYHLMMIRR